MEPVADRDDEQRHPSAEAILAGTLGLMTAHAQAACDGERQHIARSIRANLSQLAVHPDLSPHFQMALSTLGTHWQVLEQQYGDTSAPQDSTITPAGSKSVH